MISEAVEQLIQDWSQESDAEILLQLTKQGADAVFVLNQIKGRRKASSKLPSWCRAGIVFPPYLSIEQCSSEATARWKQQFVQDKTVLDLTGGFAVDSSIMAQVAKRLSYCEQQEELATIVAHNTKIMGLDNMKVFHGNGLDIMENHLLVDLIYIDPARREQGTDKKKKLYRLADCTPDVQEIYPRLLDKAKQVLIKLSPMIDIHHLQSSLEYIRQIQVVAVQNEVKEILVLLESPNQQSITNKTSLTAVNIDTGNIDVYQSFDAANEPLHYGNYQTFLYEPNRALLKADLHDEYAASLGLSKLHANTQLYTASSCLQDFQGRIFKIETEIPLKYKQFKKQHALSHANVISRNHPLKASEIEKRLQLKPGGDAYILAFQQEKSKKALLCQRIK